MWRTVEKIEMFEKKMSIIEGISMEDSRGVLMFVRDGIVVIAKIFELNGIQDRSEILLERYKRDKKKHTIHRHPLLESPYLLVFDFCSHAGKTNRRSRNKETNGSRNG